MSVSHGGVERGQQGKRTVGLSLRRWWWQGLASWDTGGHEAAGGPRPGGVLIPPSSPARRGSGGWLVVSSQQGGRWPVGGGPGRPRKAGGQARVSLLLSGTVASVAEVASQRPRPGHKGRGHSVSPYRLEGRWPGLGARAPLLGVRDLKPERSVELLLSFLALAEGPQDGLLGTGVRGLLRGWTSGDALSALRRIDFDGDRAPDVSGVPGIPKPSLPEALLILGQIQPHGGVVGLGPRPALRVDVVDRALVPVPLAAGGSGSLGPAIRGWGRLCGLGCAQVAAQVAAHDRGAAGRGLRLPDVSEVFRRQAHRLRDRWYRAQGQRVGCRTSGPSGHGVPHVPGQPCEHRDPTRGEAACSLRTGTSGFPLLVPSAWLWGSGQRGPLVPSLFF